MSRRAGLWAEIGLNLALLTVLVSVLDAGVLYLVTRNVLLEASVSVTEGAAAVVARELASAPKGDWGRVIESHRRGQIGELTVYSPTGARLAGDDVPAGGQVSAVFISREMITESTVLGTRVLAPVGAPGRPSAVVAVRMDEGTVSGPVWTVIGLHAVLSGAAIVLFGFFLFRRTVLGPVRRLQQGTEAIAGGAFETRIPDVEASEFAEEFAALARALNGLAQALGGYRTRTDDQLRQLTQANEELQRTQEALLQSEKLASVGRLAAGLAHEIGNPLAAVRAYLELLVADVDPSLATELLGRSRAEVERMHGILRSLLDFARVERRELGWVRLDQVAANALGTVRHQPAFREASLDLGVEGEPVVRGDASKLHQLVVNLLLNSGAAGARRVAVRARAYEGGSQLEVEDDGHGIATENLGRILEPFFTTRPPGEGTGLGLAIVHRVAEEHGAKIHVESTLGEGTIFRLTFPAAADDQPAGVGGDIST
ncbi:MAG: HAMP domain-containing histidine kinase [Myxococcales bacterium]|nr:HAMP domain-containing histidine kinase [Myxococcales bacterium]